MSEENQSKTNPNASVTGMIQTGYETALQKTAGIINDFNFSNDKNRSQVVNNFKDNLMSLDREVVKAVFDGAGAIRNKPDETFTIPALPGVAIPKKIVQELKVLPKKFFEEYDTANRAKNEIINQAKAGSLAEGAETKLTSAKQAVFGKGFGAVGTALGSMVGLKPINRSTPEKKAVPEAVPEKITDKEKRIEKIAGRQDKRAKKPTPKTTEEQDLEILKEEREDIKKKQAQKVSTKVKTVADVAQYQKSFNEILDNLEKNPDPFANNGAAFFGIRKLKQEVRQASKKDAQPELKNINDRLDELGSEYRTAEQEQRAGKNGKARLFLAVKDIRTMSGTAQASPTSQPADTTELDQEWTRLAEVTTPANQTEKTVFKPAPLSPPPAPAVTDRRGIKSASKTAKPFVPTATDINQRLNQISNRETEIKKRLADIKQPAPDTGRKTELAQEVNLLEQELEQLNPQKQALKNLQTDLIAEPGGSAVPRPEILRKGVDAITQQESQINARLEKINLEEKALAGIKRQQPGSQTVVEQRQALNQEKAGLIKQADHLQPQKQALQNLLRDVEKLSQVTAGAGLAGLAGATIMGTTAPATATTATGAETAIDIKAGLKSQITAQPTAKTPPTAPSGATPQPPVQIQAQAQASQETSVTVPPALRQSGQPTQSYTSQPSSVLNAGMASSGRRSKLKTYGSQAVTGQTVTTGNVASRAMLQTPGQPNKTAITITEPGRKVDASTSQIPGQETEQEANLTVMEESPVKTGTALSAPTGMVPAGKSLGGSKRASPAGRRSKSRAPLSRTSRKTGVPSTGGYQKVGPQEIKPPIGRGLDLGRAMNLASRQALAGRSADQKRAPEGLDLSTGGLESGLSEGGFMSSAIPTQDEFLYNPLRAYNQPSVYAHRAPGSAYEAEENEDEYMSAGGEVTSDLERLSALEAGKQKSRALTGQLLGPDAGIGAEPRAQKQEVPSPQAQEFSPSERGSVIPKEIPRLMRLEAARGSKIQRLNQAKQKITELKEQFDSAKKAVQQFRDLKNVGELLAGVSGWTLLALWIEWNLDIINKRIANSAIPFLEKAPSPDAPPWEKGKHAVKDGVTIFANIFIPISALASFLMPLIITAIITLSALGAVGATFLTVANFFGISIL